MKTYVLVIAALLIAACKTQDRSLVGRPVPKSPVIHNPIHHNTSGEAPIVFEPKVDILFIIDDSQSMDPYQQRLRENVRQFVSAISRSSAIDFHIGVTQVWDSKRYSGGIVSPNCGDHVNYEAIGALRPLKSPEKPALLDQFDKRFITKKPEFEYVLEQSVVIGVQPLVKNKPGRCESGPEVEEILPVIWASFQPEAINRYNQNFWRPDSFKVFMILSDAKEGSNLTAKYVDSVIRQWVGAPPKGPQDKYRVYLAGMVPGTQVTQSCRPDFGFQGTDGRGGKVFPSTIPQHELHSMAQISGGKTFSISSPNYGQQLARFGDEIKQATLKNKRQKLPHPPNMNETELPEAKRFQLKFGDVVLREGALQIDSRTGRETISDGADWAYDAQNNEVVIRGSFWEEHPKAAIDIVYVPVTDTRTARPL